MKRILLSLSMVALVGSIATVGYTGAFFSDTETSSNNIFTAGSIDLKIDHSLSTYNGANVGGDLTIVSDNQTTFTGDDGLGPAIKLTFIHTAWTADLDGGHVPTATDGSTDGSFWIWSTQGPTNPNITQTNTFTRTFTWNGPVTGANLYIAADNWYSVVINGHAIGSELVNDNNFQAATEDTYVVPAADINQGANTITVVGINEGFPGGPTGNPAGILFKLIIHGQQLFVDPIDLPGTPFWHFDDVKPQDQGRDVFSLHVGTNDAWACMIVKNIQNNENTHIQPEINAGDLTAGPINNGELGNYLKLFLWRDTNGDGIYNAPGETPLTPQVGTALTSPGPITIAIHDSTTGNGALVASTTEKVGAAWCVGQLNADPLTGTISCDGSGTNVLNANINQSQTDSTLADLEFFATQQRNQPNFKCTPSTCSFDANANLVSDGGFELPLVTDASNKWDIFPSPAAGWNILWRDPAPLSPTPRPPLANLELHRGVLGAAFEGQQYAELDSDWDGHAGTFNGEPSATIIYQNIPTQVGASYSLTYRFAPRPGQPASENQLESRLGGQLMNDSGPVAGGGSNLVSGDWILKGPYNFVATSTVTQLRFTDLGSPNDSLGTFLDDVQLKQTSCVNPV